ncbi:hypothetical protein BOTBODRAFT_509808 [Botryobasidium botryosum FD-172 SS1]|uniref:Uncharacterized protein n=1 Tax=Botryobasidium botryosum (strain FD-172 SS1) TaxID=930990 RepID=A0A067MRJ0_BOTB1|nr:hypothetical protein BOTBODRAFT_509808 [Botryobasidium botryosum FD-172 SS1]
MTQCPNLGNECHRVRKVDSPQCANLGTQRVLPLNTEMDSVAVYQDGILSSRPRTSSPRKLATGYACTAIHSMFSPQYPRPQMDKNSMYLYSTSGKPAATDQTYGNLVTLCAHIHGLFDAPEFLVSKDGKLFLSFCKLNHAAKLYHNAPFKNAYLVNEFLYARFAFSVMKIARATVAPAQIRLLEGRSGGSDSGGDGDDDDSSGGSNDDSEGPSEDGRGDLKRKPGQEEQDDDDEEGEIGQPSKKIKLSGNASAELDTLDPQERERQELEEDLAIAEEIHPFFGMYIPFSS